MPKIEIKRIDPKLPLPKFETENSAGMDLYASEEVTLAKGEIRLIPTGISVAIPEGYEAQLRPRSGLALKYGITLLNSPGTIDADYRGEVGVIVANFGQTEFQVKAGMRIAQMVISKYEKVDWVEVEKLGETKRGSKGFGSTGL